MRGGMGSEWLDVSRSEKRNEGTRGNSLAIIERLLPTHHFAYFGAKLNPKVSHAPPPAATATKSNHVGRRRSASAIAITPPTIMRH